MELEIGQTWKCDNQSITLLAKALGCDEFLARYEYDNDVGSGYSSYSAKQINRNYTLVSANNLSGIEIGQVWRNKINQDTIIKVLTSSSEALWWVVESKKDLPSSYCLRHKDVIREHFTLID